MPTQNPTLNDPVTAHLRVDYPLFARTQTVGETLESLRATGMGDQVLYIYVTDEDRRLVGVIPTRRLITSQPAVRLEEIMIRKVVSLPETATVFDACDLFVLHRFLAFPVVDAGGRVTGTIDVSLFTEEVFDFAEVQNVEDVYQFIGVRLSEIRNASPLAAFRLRIPWLVATLLSGVVCAVIARFYEATMARALVLAAFLALALGLGESVAIQSMTLTLQTLHDESSSWARWRRRLAREAATTLLLGSVLGALVALASLPLGAVPAVAASMGGSIALAIVAAGCWGVSVPMGLRALRRDPRIAAGPITLAIADLTTIVLYLQAARMLLAVSG